MTISPLTEATRGTFGIGRDVTGAVVTAVEPNSEAELEGIVPGTVITAVGNTPVATPADILAQVDQLRSQGRDAVPLKLFGSQGFPFVGLRLSGT
jgi:serine protease Do